MRLSRIDSVPVLIIMAGAAVCTLFLVPAQGSAQDSLSVSCVSVQFLSPFEDLTRCAEEGVAEAQGSLGLRYYAGSGATPLDYAVALHWFRRAAEQGYAEAQVMLGVMTASGMGLPQDDAKALQWYNLSAAQGNETAQRNKDIIEQRMTREQIAEARRLSREWLETHTRDGGN